MYVLVGMDICCYRDELHMKVTKVPSGWLKPNQPPLSYSRVLERKC